MTFCLFTCLSEDTGLVLDSDTSYVSNIMDTAVLNKVFDHKNHFIFDYGCGIHSCFKSFENKEKYRKKEKSREATLEVTITRTQCSCF